jgi:hypothetical protein
MIDPWFLNAVALITESTRFRRRRKDGQDWGILLKQTTPPRAPADTGLPFAAEPP